MVVEQGRFAGCGCDDLLLGSDCARLLEAGAGEEAVVAVAVGEAENEVTERGLSGREERDGLVKERKERVMVGEEEAEVMVGRCIMEVVRRVEFERGGTQ